MPMSRWNTAHTAQTATTISSGRWRGVSHWGNCPAWPIPMGCGPYEAQANGTVTTVTTRVTGGLYAKQGMYVTNTVVTQQGTGVGQVSG